MSDWQGYNSYTCSIVGVFGKWIAAVQAVLIAMLFAGCGQGVEGPKSELFEQTYEVDPEAGLSIRNTDGSIVIHGTETPVIRLRALKKASSSEDLKGISITASAGAKAVSITTRFLPQKNKALSSGSRTVDYTIEVPLTVNLTRVDLENGKVLIDGMRGEDLHTTVVDGQLVIRNCCGNSHATMAHGTLDLYFDSCDRKRFSIDAQMTNGDARVFVPRGAPFRIQAETITGTLTNAFANVLNLNGRTERKVDLSTGKEVRQDIKLRVTTGDIKIAESGSETAADSANPGR